jgi:hypothetical protein
MRQVEEALARQEVYGGDVVTNLLEVAPPPATDEAALTAALADSLEVRPAPLEWLRAPDPRAVGRVERGLAESHAAVPLALEGDAIVIAISEALPAGVREAFAASIGAEVRLVAAPTARLSLAMERAYGTPMDERARRLVARLDGGVSELASTASADPRPRASSIPELPDDPLAPGAGPFAPRPQPDPAPPPDLAQIQHEAASVSEPATPVADPHPSPQPQPQPQPDPAPQPQPTPHLDPQPQPEVASPPPGAEASEAEPTFRRVSNPQALQKFLRGALRKPAPASAAATPTPAPTRADEHPSQPAGRRRRGPFTRADAEAAFVAATSSDGVLAALLEFAEQFVSYVALFRVHGDVAAGWDARGPGASGERVRKMGVPLDLVSIFASARKLRAPVERASVPEPLDGAVAEDLERGGVASAIALPLAVGTRVVAIVWLDDGEQPLSLLDVEEVVKLASVAAGALGRLVVAKKQGRPASAVAAAPTARFPSRPPRAGRVDSAARVRALAAALTPRPTSVQGSAPPPAVDAASAQSAASEAERPASAPSNEAVTATRLVSIVDAAAADAASTTPKIVSVAPIVSAALDDAMRHHTSPYGVEKIDQEALEASELAKIPLAARWLPRRVTQTAFPALPQVPVLPAGVEPLPPPSTPSPPPTSVPDPTAASPMPMPPPPAFASRRALTPAIPREDPDELRARTAGTPTPPSRPGGARTRDVVWGPADLAAAAALLPDEPAAGRADATSPLSSSVDSAPDIAVTSEAHVDEGSDDAPLDDDEPHEDITEADVDAELVHVSDAELDELLGAPSRADERIEAYPLRLPPRPSERLDVALPKVIVALEPDHVELVETLLRGGDGSAAAADKLASLGILGITALMERFPGPTRSDRTAAASQLPAPSASGPILSVIVRLGRVAHRDVIARTNDPLPETRFWATYLLTELADPAASAALLPRLLDDDAAVRRIAPLAARAMFRVARDTVIDVIDPLVGVALDDGATKELRTRAIDALVDLREAQAVEGLVLVLEVGDESIAYAAHGALVKLTCHDPTRTGGSWASWFDKQKGRARTEWLIDALLDDDPALREAASSELKATTKQYFGYYADLPRADRERAHARYRAWWEQDGRSAVS